MKFSIVHIHIREKKEGLVIAILVLCFIVIIFTSVGCLSGELIGGIMATVSAFIAFMLSSVALGIANSAEKRYTMSADSAAKTLRDYKILHDSGLLTDREFEEQKARILRQLGL